MEQELIPIRTDSYDSLTFVHTKCASVYKKVGYTPLQVVKDILPYLHLEEAEKITYVGRLDPMAEGWMHVLWNGDMEEKAKLAALDKIYEIEVVLGVSTDTGDMLGLVTGTDVKNVDATEISNAVQSFVGPFTYAYPKYSSPNIKETLKGGGQKEKLQKGTIYSIEEVRSEKIKSVDLEKSILDKLLLCKMDGDFRLDSIQERWRLYFQKNDKSYLKVTLRVECSSGTYMRTLAEEIGKKVGMSAYAQGIKRIGIKSSVY